MNTDKFMFIRDTEGRRLMVNLDFIVSIMEMSNGSFGIKFSCSERITYIDSEMFERIEKFIKGKWS